MSVQAWTVGSNLFTCPSLIPTRAHTHTHTHTHASFISPCQRKTDVTAWPAGHSVWVWCRIIISSSKPHLASICRTLARLAQPQKEHTQRQVFTHTHRPARPATSNKSQLSTQVLFLKTTHAFTPGSCSNQTHFLQLVLPEHPRHLRERVINSGHVFRAADPRQHGLRATVSHNYMGQMTANGADVSPAVHVVRCPETSPFQIALSGVFWLKIAPR